MDEKTKDALKEQLAKLDKAESALRIARLPFDDAIEGIDDARQSILDAHDTDIAGRCVGCGDLLLVGDKGSRCFEGELLCEGCSYSWADVKDQWDRGEREDADDAEARAAFMASYDAHIASGGNPDDLILHEL